MTQTGARNVASAQPNAGHRSSPNHAIPRLAWRSLRTLGSGIKWACRVFVNFWNIPVLGENETPESRRFRIEHHIRD
jgi:hypothetical protein